MALADFGYRQLPNGVYQFQRPGEPALRLPSGPGAELAQRIAQTQANLQRFPDLRVAGPGGGESTIDRIRQINEGNATRATGFNPNAPLTDMGGPDAAIRAMAGAPPAASAAPPAQPQGGPRPLGFGYRLSDRGTIQTYTPGSPGITKEQLQQRDAEAVSQRVSKTETRTGGFDPNLEYLKGIADNYRQREELAEEIRASNVARLQTEATSAAETEAIRAQHRREQEALQREIDERVKRDQELADRARKEYEEGARVDPGRIFSGAAGTVRLIGSAIANAMGAFGAVLGRTDNFAMNLFNATIERDIRAQEQENEIKRDRSETALAQLQRSGLNQEQSRLLLRQIQLDHVGALAEKARVAQKIGENDTNYKALKLGLEREQMDFVENYRRASEGTRAEEVRSQYAHAKKASAGGWRDVPDQLGTAAKIQAQEERRVDIDAKRAKAAAQGGADEVEVRAYKDKIAQVEEGQAALEAIARLQGLTFNPRTGRWEGEASGSWRGHGILASDEAQAYGAQVDSLAPGIGRGLEGNAPNESTMDAIKDSLKSASGNKVKEGINALWARLQDKRRSADATVPPAIVNQATQRQQQVDQTNIQQRTGVAPPVAGGAPLPPPSAL